MIRLEQKEQTDFIEDKKNKILLKKAMKGFELHRLEKIQEKYQMLKII